MISEPVADPTRTRGRVSSGVRSRAATGYSSPASMHPRAALRALLEALDARGLAASPRAVAVALWTHADPCGRCWPSQTTLARLVGRCERTVRDAVKALEAAGVLLRDVPALRERRVRRRTTAYRFTVGAWLPVSARVPLTSTAPSTTRPREALDVEGDATVPPVEAAPVPDALTLDGGASRPSPAEHPGEALDGVLEHVGPVDIEGREAEHQVKPLDGVRSELGAVEASPATTAPPSPATTAGRRSQRFKSPPMPAPSSSQNSNRPPPARCAPRPWSLPELGAAVARLRSAARARE